MASQRKHGIIVSDRTLTTSSDLSLDVFDLVRWLWLRWLRATLLVYRPTLFMSALKLGARLDFGHSHDGRKDERLTPQRREIVWNE